MTKLDKAAGPIRAEVRPQAHPVAGTPRSNVHRWGSRPS